MPEGLVAVIVQSARNGEVLMLGYANDQSLALTRETGYMHFWSRSRKRIWMKGETSGNRLRIVDLAPDCDGDCLLARVEVEGKGLVCHEGTRSCFASPTPGSGEVPDLPSALAAVFEQRVRQRPAGSHVVEVLDKRNEAYKKLGEETVEFMLAATEGDRGRMVSEAADMYFHMLLAFYDAGISYDEVAEELRKRMK